MKVCRRLQLLHDKMVAHEEIYMNQDPPALFESSPASSATSMIFDKLHAWSSAFKRVSSGSILPQQAPRRNSNPVPNQKKASGTHPEDDSLPRGVYVHGDVGCGKTFLMDIFFEHAPVRLKRRVHFHSFLLDVQQRIHKWRHEPRPDGEYDPIPPLAHSLACESRLLCFDEFQVTDISDAAILHRLLEELLLRYNVVLVATSNRPPVDLYKNGINRELFLPCIHLMNQELDIVDMDSDTDHRLLTGALDSMYLSPNSSENRRVYEGLWRKAIQGHTVRCDELDVTGRTLEVPQTAGGAARFAFDYLCDNALGAGDYIAIARKYHTVFLDDIPRMTLQEKVQARRFIVLIDALYEHKGGYSRLLLGFRGLGAASASDGRGCSWWANELCCSETSMHGIVRPGGAVCG